MGQTPLRLAKADVVAFVSRFVQGTYTSAKRVHLVLDNLNTHFWKCFEDVLGRISAARLLRRVGFHNVPRHASWLSMAGTEIGVLARQCLNRRLPDAAVLTDELAASQHERSAQRKTTEWKLNRQNADRKLGRHRVPLLRG